MSDAPAMHEVLGADAPSNWGKWGPQDDDLADACAADGRWSFFYVAAPLKVVSGTGAPVNPVAIR
jgi:hypothetical protein